MGARSTSALVVSFAAIAFATSHAVAADGGQEARERASVAASRTDTSRCRRRGSKTITRSATGRVYSKPIRKTLDDGFRPRRFTVAGFFGCLYATGRHYALSYEPDDGTADNYEWRMPTEFRIAGRYVAFAERTGMAQGRASLWVVRRDLKTGASRRESDPSAVQTDPAESPFRDEDTYYVGDLALKRTGALAWIVVSRGMTEGCGREPSPYKCRVFRDDRRGRALLDEGYGIREKSLTLKRSRVTWINSGRRRSATLR